MSEGDKEGARLPATLRGVQIEEDGLAHHAAD